MSETIPNVNFNPQQPEADDTYKPRHAAGDGLSTAQAAAFADRYAEVGQQREALRAEIIAQDATIAEEARVAREHSRNRWGALSRGYHAVKDSAHNAADKVRMTIPEGYRGEHGVTAEPIKLGLGKTALAKLNGGLLARDVWGPSKYGAAYDPVRHNPVIRAAYEKGMAAQHNKQRAMDARVNEGPGYNVDPTAFSSRSNRTAHNQ